MARSKSTIQQRIKSRSESKKRSSSAKFHDVPGDV